MNTKQPKVMVVGYLLHYNGGWEVFMGTKKPTESALKLGIAGKVVGFGGKLDSKDVSEAHCFAREIVDETTDDTCPEHGHITVDPKDVKVAARILVKNEDGRSDIILVFVLTKVWSGTAKESREMEKARFYFINDLPKDILDSDRIILPRIANGELLEGEILYTKDMEIVSCSIRSVSSLE